MENTNWIPLAQRRRVIKLSPEWFKAFEIVAAMLLAACGSVLNFCLK